MIYFVDCLRRTGSLIIPNWNCRGYSVSALTSASRPANISHLVCARRLERLQLNLLSSRIEEVDSRAGERYLDHGTGKWHSDSRAGEWYIIRCDGKWYIDREQKKARDQPRCPHDRRASIEEQNQLKTANLYYN